MNSRMSYTRTHVTWSMELDVFASHDLKIYPCCFCSFLHFLLSSLPLYEYATIGDRHLACLKFWPQWIKLGIPVSSFHVNLYFLFPSNEIAESHKCIFNCKKVLSCFLQ